jgi:hypothetical protein
MSPVQFESVIVELSPFLMKNVRVKSSPFRIKNVLVKSNPFQMKNVLIKSSPLAFQIENVLIKSSNISNEKCAGKVQLRGMKNEEFCVMAQNCAITCGPAQLILINQNLSSPQKIEEVFRQMRPRLHSPSLDR